jgi:hypothetical protein
MFRHHYITQTTKSYCCLTSSSILRNRSRKNGSHMAHWKLLLQLLILGPVALCGSAGPTQDLVTALEQEQRDSGLTLAGFGTDVVIVRFGHAPGRSLNLPGRAASAQYAVPTKDGSEIAFRTVVSWNLAIVHHDGGDFREYPEVSHPDSLCWSPDGKRLVVSADEPNSRTKPPRRKLFILDLASGTTREIGDVRAYTTPQCWSADSKQIVYGIGESIGIYDLAESKWHELAHGVSPSWSPNGGGIAFFDHDNFYMIAPSGGERKLLFKTRHNSKSGLVWSLDSRLVGYVNYCCALHFSPDCTMAELRVHRLADDSDVRVASFCGLALHEWVWLRGPEAGASK